jgi:DNA repair protein RecN (Recombination protein N)
VRPGCERAEIIAAFDIAGISAAGRWLAERDLDAGDEVLLRRVITAEGRSRAYINGSASTLQDCTELGGLLIDIHSQHAHQSLLRRPYQRDLLDAYAGHLPLRDAVRESAAEWLRRQRELNLLAGSGEERAARLQLLDYQVEELDTLAVGEDELAALENEEKLLANAEDILASAHQALGLCEQQESGLQQALQLLSGAAHATTAAADARELLDSAAIQTGEARGEIQRHIDGVEVDPERLAAVQARLGAIYEVARKHRVMPEQLAGRHAQLREELDSLRDGGARIESLEAEMATLASRYAKDAGKLSKQRARAAKRLVAEVEKVLGSLAMAQCSLDIALVGAEARDPRPAGLEDAEILVSTNPGAAPQPLGKIASGGELSRISLAIQVVAASAGTVPSMVFDEVDVGVGGAVAEVVGRLLRQLAENTQVLCVTHLPQVAAQGHSHLQVTKHSDATSVETRLARLDDEDKVQEIARMLGGVKITKQTLAHAREMLAG